MVLDIHCLDLDCMFIIILLKRLNGQNRNIGMDIQHYSLMQ